MDKTAETDSSRPAKRDDATRREALRRLGQGLAGLALGLGAGVPVAAFAAAFSSPRLSIAVRGTRSAGGRDILLVPGLASGPAVWNALLPQLPGNRLHLVHIAGFAGKPAGANARGPVFGPVAAELARYIRTQGLHSPALIGHSMGGLLALRLGLALPGTVSRIMVVDMLPDGSAMVGGTSSGLGYLAGQLNAYLTGTLAGRQILTRMVEQNGGRGNDPQVVSQSLSDLAQTDLKPRLRTLHMPVTLAYALPADSQAAAERTRLFHAAYAGLPQARFAGIGPSGHMVMQDQPAAFARAVRRFLQ